MIHIHVIMSINDIHIKSERYSFEPQTQEKKLLYTKAKLDGYIYMDKH